MTTKDLIGRLWDKVPGVRKKDVVAVMEAYGEEVKRRVLEDEQVALPGIGKFYLVTQRPRNYYNKTTGTIAYHSGGKKIIRFRMFPKAGK